MKKITVITIFTIFLILAFGILLWVGSKISFKPINTKGVENSKICDNIKPGITINELYDILGKPIKEYEKNGEIWVYFESNPIAAGLIKARIDRKNNTVLILKCWEDSKPNWDLTKSGI